MSAADLLSRFRYLLLVEGVHDEAFLDGYCGDLLRSLGILVLPMHGADEVLDLGNPPDSRESFRNGDGIEGRMRLRSILLNGHGDALARVVALASQQRIAVLCVEREHHRCHREVIADMVVEQNPDIEILQVL